LLATWRRLVELIRVRAQKTKEKVKPKARF